jgi:hypothetical protein
LKHQKSPFETCFSFETREIPKLGNSLETLRLDEIKVTWEYTRSPDEELATIFWNLLKNLPHILYVTVGDLPDGSCQSKKRFT